MSRVLLVVVCLAEEEWLVTRTKYIFTEVWC